MMTTDREVILRSIADQPAKADALAVRKNSKERVLALANSIDELSKGLTPTTVDMRSLRDELHRVTCQLVEFMRRQEELFTTLLK